MAEIVLQTNQSLERFEESQPDSEAVEKSISFFDLFRFASKTDICMMVVASICSAFMGAAIPIFAYLTGNMIDSFTSRADAYEEAKKNMFYYIYLGIGALVAGTVMFAGWMISGERQGVKCRRQYFKSLLQQEMAWFDCQKQAAISSTFQLDSMSYQLAVGEKISTLIMVLSMLLTGIGISFYLGWILTLIVLAYMPIVIIVWTKNVTTRTQIDGEEDEIYRDSDSKLQQTLSSIKLVKQLNAQKFQTNLQERIMDKIKESYMSTIPRFACANGLAILALNLGFALTMWYGGQCVFNTSKCPKDISSQPYTAGNVIKIFYSLFLPAFSLNQLAPCLQKVAEGKAAAARIFAIIDRVPKIKTSITSIIPSSFKGLIELRDVTFAYPKDKSKNILQNFNLRIDCQHSAIIGESGGGKSTIFQLIMRFYDPDRGTVYLDGEDLRNLDLKWLRSRISYVTQEPVLFATSIRENLLLGKPDASEKDILEALKKAEALNFVEELHDKLETFVGSGGSQLSGGQKQRIAIARALLKNPKMLLMDEATSALDRKNEAEILNTLIVVSRDMVSISITHRKRYLRNCDKVYEIMDKKVKKITFKKGVKQLESLEFIQPKNSKSIKANKFSEDTQMISRFLSSEIDLGVRVQLEKDKKSLPLEQKSKDNQQKGLAEVEEGQNTDLKRIVEYITDKKCLIFLGIVLPLIEGLVFPAIGVMISKVVIAQLKYPLDPDYYKTQVLIFSLIIAALSLLGSFTNTASNVIYMLLGEHSVKKIRLQAIQKIFNMPVQWFDQVSCQPEKVTTSLTQSCKYMYNFVKLFTPHLLFVIVNILGSMIGALIFQWRTGLTSFGLIPLIVLSQAIQFGFIQGLSESKGKIYGDSSQIINEAVMNIKTVLSLNSPDCMRMRYQTRIDQILGILERKCILSGFMYGVAYFCQFVSFALMFFLAAVYVSNYDIQIDGSLSAIFLVVFAGISAGNQTNFMPDISEAKIAAKKMFSIVDLEDEYQQQARFGYQQLKSPIRGNIQFKNVTFKYENRENIALNNFSLKIKEGQNIGIVGHSGCGKSTIFGMLLGFYYPNSGTILLQGINIRDYDLHHLRSSFGFVTQQPTLFNQTIEWNIRYNLEDASEEDILKAAQQASFNPNKEKFKEHLSDQLQVESPSSPNIKSTDQMIGFQKNVGPKGSHMSGGQKQRIAIARAILRKPTVLLLDEATSALDPENEVKVQHSLDSIMKGKTVLNISHRLETIENSSMIFVLNKGRLEQFGTYHELVDKGQAFFRLLKGATAEEEHKV